MELAEGSPKAHVRLHWNRKHSDDVSWKKFDSLPACPGVQYSSGPVPRDGHFYRGCLSQLPLPPGGNAQDKNQRLWNGPPGTPKTCCHLRVGDSLVTHIHYLVTQIHDAWALTLIYGGQDLPGDLCKCGVLTNHSEISSESYRQAICQITVWRFVILVWTYIEDSGIRWFFLKKSTFNMRFILELGA